jgi:glycosyltransferase involved in cell wall biosynthesis
MNATRVIALLGRRDEPTDAVEEYCHHLGEALNAHQFQLKIRSVPWNTHGWSASLEALRLQARDWRGTWVFVQYTALAWSVRGFPNRLIRVLHVLRSAGARIGLVFHDAEPFGGGRLVDRIRRSCQLRVMRRGLSLANHAVFTVEPGRLGWLVDTPNRSSFVPVGANLPFPLAPQQHEEIHSPGTVAVYSITGGTAGDRETRDIIAAIRHASERLGNLRLLVFGRHAELRQQELQEGLRDCKVELNVTGVLEEKELVRRFAVSDLLLFVRGTISSRRGSAIAGIACGLPVIALQGSETAPPITEAGVILFPEKTDEKSLQTQLGGALVQILSENDLRLQLIQRNRVAYENYFSWQAIANRYAQFLQERD